MADTGRLSSGRCQCSEEPANFWPKGFDQESKKPNGTLALWVVALLSNVEVAETGYAG
jgi:hypothetical protein